MSFNNYKKIKKKKCSTDMKAIRKTMYYPCTQYYNIIQ